MRVVCLSDTHNEQFAVPDGDLLIHAGDATVHGTIEEVSAFNVWFSSLPHKHKIFVAGNHDWLFERNPTMARAMLDKSIIYLLDCVAEIEGIRIYGSPWQPRFYDWAFNLNRGRELAEKWAAIPEGIDILITHGPPAGILDRTERGDHAGCEELAKRLAVVRPKVHIFGHIHEGYGVVVENGIRYVNASNCDENYNRVNPPIVFDI